MEEEEEEEEGLFKEGVTLQMSKFSSLKVKADPVNITVEWPLFSDHSPGRFQ